MERAATQQHGDERLLPAAPGAVLGWEGGDVDKNALESRRGSDVAISFHHQQVELSCCCSSLPGRELLASHGNCRAQRLYTQVLGAWVQD